MYENLHKKKINRGAWVIVPPDTIGIVFFMGPNDPEEHPSNPRTALDYGEALVHLVDPANGETIGELKVDLKAIRRATFEEIPACRRPPITPAAGGAP